MNRITGLIEATLFAARWLMVPIYLAMVVLLGMLVFFFLADIIHALPELPGMSEKGLIILTLSLIDLSLVANLVILVILSGYENFVSRADLPASGNRPDWLNRIDFTGLKLKLIGSITIIAAVHILSAFLEGGPQANALLGWQVAILLVFGLLGLLFALTERLGGGDD